MSQVTGQEGLAVDVRLDARIDAAKFEDPNGASGNDGTFMLENVDIDNGPAAGDQALLQNLTVNADENQGLVLGAPNGNFTLSAQNFCLNNDFGPNSCTGNIAGQLEARGITLKNSEFRMTGRGSGNDGLVADMDMNMTIDQFRLTDRDGAAGAGDQGTVVFEGLQIGDKNSANGTTLLTDFTIDADANEGLVVGLPSSPNLDIGFNNLDVVGSAANAGSLFVENINFQPGGIGESELRITGNNGGLNVGGELAVRAGSASGDPIIAFGTMTGFAFDLISGAVVVLGGIDANDITIGNDSTGGDGFNIDEPITFNGLTVDVDGKSALEIGFPNFPGSGAELSVDNFALGNDQPALGVKVENFRTNGSFARIKPANDGLKSDVTVDLTLGSVALVDRNGSDCTGCTDDGVGGVLRLGKAGESGSDVTVESVNSSGNSAPLVDTAIDVDGAGGANSFAGVEVRSPTSGQLTVKADDVVIGDNSAFGLEVKGANFNPPGVTGRTKVRINGAN